MTLMGKNISNNHRCGTTPDCLLQSAVLTLLHPTQKLLRMWHESHRQMGALSAIACFALAVSSLPVAESGTPSVARRLLVSPPTQPSSIHFDKSLLIPIIAGSAAAAVIILAIFIFLIKKCLCSKTPKPDKAHSTTGSRRLYARIEDSHVKSIRLNDIQIATNGFAESMVILDKGYGVVYMGEGPNGEAWAIKRAKKATLEGVHLFRNEVDFLSQINHENIVSLLAACDENNEQILVFEHVANGTLKDWLRPSAIKEGSQGSVSLTFTQRLDIAIGIAEALRYLHSFTKPTIIHRDVKSETILLDDKFKVKLGGLGLLKHLPGEAMRLRMAKKKAYLDPEFFQTFKVTTKCDVYSFGVVLLELISGKAPVIQSEAKNPDEELESPHAITTLTQWAVPLIDVGKVDLVVDSRLVGDYPKDSMLALAKVATSCVAPLRKDRPDMAKVAFLLAELKRPSTSRTFNIARFNSSGHKVVPVSR